MRNGIDACDPQPEVFAHFDRLPAPDGLIGHSKRKLGVKRDVELNDRPNRNLQNGLDRHLTFSQNHDNRNRKLEDSGNLLLAVLRRRRRRRRWWREWRRDRFSGGSYFSSAGRRLRIIRTHQRIDIGL